jgi:hypothetical protein
MEIKELQNRERRTIAVSIRTFPSYSIWLKEKEISPSKMFNKCIEELMKNETKIKK